MHFNYNNCHSWFFGSLGIVADEFIIQFRSGANEQTHSYRWLNSHITANIYISHMNESCHIDEWVTRQIITSPLIYIYHTWRSHVTQMNESHIRQSHHRESAHTTLQVVKHHCNEMSIYSAHYHMGRNELLIRFTHHSLSLKKQKNPHCNKQKNYTATQSAHYYMSTHEFFIRIYMFPTRHGTLMVYLYASYNELFICVTHINIWVCGFISTAYTYVPLRIHIFYIVIS